MYETPRVNVGNLDFRAGSCPETKTLPDGAFVHTLRRTMISARFL